MKRVGILGGGQLARMLALAGLPLGVRCRFLDPSAEACAGAVAEGIRAPYDDPAALADLVEGCDAVTFEFENVPVTALELLEGLGAAVSPPARALEVASDRLREKELVLRLGGAVPAFHPVEDDNSLEEAIARVGFPALLKTRRLGYDGKGQVRVGNAAEARAGWEQLGRVPVLMEQQVAFRRELAQLAVRSARGEMAYYPVVETRQRNGILHAALAPAPNAAEPVLASAQQLARRVAEAFDYVGVLALELFETEGGVLFNELAPRVHNSGHWTIEGAVTSQFENHLRAILGWPLGETSVRCPSVLVNFVGRLPPIENLLRRPDVHFHDYGKAARPGRKLGHATALARAKHDLEDRLRELLATAFGREVLDV